MNDTGSQSRELVRGKYAQTYREYDDPRMRNKRGRALSEHDLRLFAELYSEALPSPQSRVLEVAAGTGRFTIKALELGGQIVATDVNDSLLAGLRKRTAGFATNRLEVKRDDAFALSFPPESFDIVYSIHFIPRLLTAGDQATALEEMGRVLRPGGSLIVNFRNRRSWLYGRLYKSHALASEDVRDMLAVAGLDPQTWRGKHILTRSLLDRIPLTAVPLVSSIEWRARCLAIHRAWDVFLLARKHQT